MYKIFLKNISQNNNLQNLGDAKCIIPKSLYSDLDEKSILSMQTYINLFLATYILVIYCLTSYYYCLSIFFLTIFCLHIFDLCTISS